MSGTLRGEIWGLSFAVAHSARESEGLKISKNGLHHLWMAPWTKD